MSLKESNEFVKVFNKLDDLLKERYPQEIPSKLGLTRYLEDMQAKDDLGIPTWKEDYRRLKSLRNVRNRLVHENQLDGDLVSEEDTLWLREFTKRLHAQTDPMAIYHKKLAWQAAREEAGREAVRESLLRGIAIAAGVIALCVILALIVF